MWRVDSILMKAADSCDFVPTVVSWDAFMVRILAGSRPGGPYLFTREPTRAVVSIAIPGMWSRAFSARQHSST